jgi:hypothetical protein
LLLIRASESVAQGGAGCRGLTKCERRAHVRGNTLMEQTVTLEAVKGQSVEALLHQVVAQHVTVTVLLPDGTAVVIAPRPRLQPLPVLEGYVPAGWKDALYGHD